MKTVVGLYNTVADANKVKETLRTEGYDASHITVIDQSEGATGGSTAGNATSTGQTTMEKVKGFFTSFSDHEDAHEHYAARVESGGALLAVTVPDEEAEETADMLYEHGATGIQGDYKGNSTAGAEDVAVLESSKDQYSATGNTIAASGEQVIPVVEESLVVGKRQVDRGGVRIYSHVVEKPVSADVTLHDERIVLDRRPVDRSATEADFSTGTGAIELTATGEEAVVGKTSRVIEEIRLGKTSSERTEQVTDTVRHTEVEVEPVAGSTTSTTKANDRF